MLPRLGSSKLVSSWIWITLFATSFSVVSGGWFASWVAFAPARIWHGEVWRLVTWVFVEPGPMSLVITCASIYKLGGELVQRWGEHRLRRVMLELIGGAALATTLFALLSDRTWQVERVGGWAIGDALVILWARQYADRELVLYGLLRLHGRDLVAVTIGITCVYALFSGVFAMLPELLVCAAAYGYPSARLRRA